MHNMDDTAESITHRWETLRKRSGHTITSLAKELGYKGASSIQRYGNPEQYAGGWLPPDLVRKLMKAVVGKGDPAITEIEVAELAGPEFTLVYQALSDGRLKRGDDEPSGPSRAAQTVGEKAYSSEMGAVGIPPGSIAEIDLAAGMGGGGLSIETQISDHNGLTFSADAVRDYWRLPDWLLGSINARAKSVTAIQTKGDSMEPTLYSGDVVFIDLNHRVPSPEGLYAIIDDFGGVVVKRLEVSGRDDDGDILIEVIADNPRHSRKTEKASNVHIVGRVAGRFSVM